MDPPWMERGGGKIKRGADRHYPLMKKEEILETIITCEHYTPHDNCHLYCWVTNNHFEEGLWLTKELGFRLIHPITWAKTKSGLGQYRGGQTEHCLFCVRGKAMMPKNKLMHSTLLGRGPIPVSKKHSQKPEEIYRSIEDVSPGPRLEMFAREPRPGWTSWGHIADRREPVLFRVNKKGQYSLLE